MKSCASTQKEIRPTMLFVIGMLRIGWRVQAKRDWASFPNEWAILRPSANGIIWKQSLEKKARVGLRSGALIDNAGGRQAENCSGSRFKEGQRSWDIRERLNRCLRARLLKKKQCPGPRFEREKTPPANW
jgi:hypothetical protein